MLIDHIGVKISYELNDKKSDRSRAVKDLEVLNGYNASKGYFLAEKKSIQYGYRCSLTNWDSLSYKELEEFRNEFTDLYDNVIESCFDSDLDRSFLMKGSIYMSVRMIDFLKELQVDSQLVLGDIFVHDHFYYDTSFSDIEDRLAGKKIEKAEFHLWVITGDGVVIDPVLNMMENRFFSEIKEIPDPFVYHVFDMPVFPKLCPMVMGNDIVMKIVTEQA